MGCNLFSAFTVCIYSFSYISTFFFHFNQSLILLHFLKLLLVPHQTLIQIHMFLLYLPHKVLMVFPHSSNILSLVSLLQRVILLLHHYYLTQCVVPLLHLLLMLLMLCKHWFIPSLSLLWDEWTVVALSCKTFMIVLLKHEFEFILLIWDLSLFSQLFYSSFSTLSTTRQIVSPPLLYRN